jgi:hypothetical protein
MSLMYDILCHYVMEFYYFSFIMKIWNYIYFKYVGHKFRYNNVIILILFISKLYHDLVNYKWNDVIMW